jgi:N-methylhydantoinase A
MRIGVDTGGTFTDFIVYDPTTGAFESFKLLSTPHDPAEAILEGLTRLRSVATQSVIHGSTVATNALLERKGALTALVTTAGFRDVLHIGRQNRPSLYDLAVQPPPALVPRQHRLEVGERVNYLGHVQTPLDDARIDALIAHCREHAIESVAICLLFSFANPDHERRIDQRFEEAGFFVSASNIISPEFREYERTSTTVINAYVSPVMGRYLSRLQVSVPNLQIMQSNGGMLSAQQAANQAARCILSGPAGGVIGARAVAAAIGVERVLTFDMGGTSTDVALIEGEPQFDASRLVAGLPLNIPMLSIHTVGSGGGSIASLDAGGGLQVGPQSAGADPGPASYGKGTLPTVTDANLLLGRIRPELFFGGAMQLDIERARAAFAGLAASLNLSERDCQLGVLRIVNAHMARALRVISVEKGKDPRDFDLLSFGGAGGLHAAELARELGMPRVIVPRHAATLSALGMLVADVVKDHSLTVMLPGRISLEELTNHYAPLVAKAQGELTAEGYAEVLLEQYADLRYAGQSFELRVPFSNTLIADFHRAHDRAYGYADENAAVEIVTLRVRAIAPVPAPQLPEFPPAITKVDDAIIGRFDVVFESSRQPTPFYDGDKLGPGHRIAGPAIVVQKDTTILVGQPDLAAVDAHLNLIIEVGKA